MQVLWLNANMPETEQQTHLVNLPRVRNKIHWIPRAKDRCCSGTHLQINTQMLYTTALLK